jgi:hypothetical protein
MCSTTHSVVNWSIQTINIISANLEENTLLKNKFKWSDKLIDLMILVKDIYLKDQKQHLNMPKLV